MNFKDYLMDFIKTHKGLCMYDDGLYYNGTKFTNDISHLIKDDKKINKSNFIDTLYQEIIDVYVNDLEWFLQDVEDEYDISTIGEYAHDIVNILTMVKSY